MKHWCGKGLLARDRERGRCGRCGLSTTLPVPTGMTKHDKELLKAGKGPLLGPTVEKLLKDYCCLECRNGNHAVCQDLVMWFCQCWRHQHQTPIEEEQFEDFV